MAGKTFIVQLGNAGGLHYHGAVSGNPVRLRDGFCKTHAQSGQSVLVFDEIQTLPIRCVHLFCHALNFLVEECGSSAVLCTATQPLLGNVPNPEKGQLRLADDPELMPDLAELFRQLRRVRFVDHTKSP